ncbi:hypothetical protein Tco_1426627, partial [Tanacetum coccineum]
MKVSVLCSLHVQKGVFFSGAEASNESAFKNDDDGVSGCALKPIITEGKKNNVGFCQNVVQGSGQNPSIGVSTHNSRSFIYSGFILCNNEIKIMQLERTSGAICKCNTHSDIYCGLMLCNNEIKIVHSERAIGGIVFKSIDGEIINKASTVRAPIRIGYRTSPFVHHRSMCLEVGTLYLAEYSNVGVNFNNNRKLNNLCVRATE